MTDSPWRYPGGKSRMAAGILPLIPVDTVDYCEPFVGGGGVTVKLLDRMLPGCTLVLNDADIRVAAWWRLMADLDGDGFAGLRYMIKHTDPTLETFRAVQSWGLEPVPFAHAFAGIFLNRTAFSGILSGGPIGGNVQTGPYPVGCRWNPTRLLKQHEQIRKLLLDHQVTVRADDFREVIKSCPDAFVYADPPYRTKGRRLYPAPFTPDDHEDLATLLLGRENWLLSYDDHPWVRERYADCLVEPIDTYYTVKGKGRTAPVKASELLIRPLPA